MDTSGTTPDASPPTSGPTSGQASAPITTTAALTELCARLAGHDYIAIDTEFMRETTYYAKICLIQVASSDEAASIDPLAKGLDLTPLFELMRNPDVLKVFHAGRQDLEIFVHMMGELPAPCYDSQIAAMVCGFGDQVGYDKLVHGFLNITIDKGSRFTDWSQRPLTEKQIHYALNDVIYLEQIYPMMMARITDAGRDTWLDEEMAVLADISIYQVNPDDAWRKVKQRGSKPPVLNRIKHLAAWRERQAQRRDVPKSRLIKDDTLMAIAVGNPADANALGRIRGFPGGTNGKLIPEIMKVLNDANATPKDDWPELPAPPTRRPSPSVVDILRVLLKHVTDSNGIAPRLIANADDLEKIALGQYDSVKAMHGWRYDIFGKPAEDVIAGKLAITIKGKSTKLIPVDDDKAG
ncbi:MAG: ribonuclease D [Alphaproteobacteria bacterium]|nr:ribonuclease D [Alphaproteobacteria bacterium]